MEVPPMCVSTCELRAIEKGGGVTTPGTSCKWRSGRRGTGPGAPALRPDEYRPRVQQLEAVAHGVVLRSCPRRGGDDRKRAAGGGRVGEAPLQERFLDAAAAPKGQRACACEPR